MPENLEPQEEETSGLTEETTEEATEVPEPAGDGQPNKGPEHIPYHRFQEVWNERQEARQYAQSLQMQILQMQQQIAGAQSSPQEPEPDPDVENIVKPVLNKYVRPLMQKLQQTEAELGRVQAQAEAEQAWGYVLHYVPDMEDLKDDLAREIQSKSPAVQRKITSDPDLVIELAEKVRLKRAGGKSAVSQAVQHDIKARSKSESGGARTSPTNQRNIDWLNLSDDEFNALDAKITRRRV